MKIVIIGYGKMGQAVEKIALAKNHEIVARIGRDNANELEIALNKKPDMAIEFTQPESALNNILACMKVGVPCVSGSTGWLYDFKKVKQACAINSTAFFYASNFSLGVNLFFHFNKQLAKMMQTYENYDVVVEETHHIHKKDAPSGTAITTAEGILESYTQKSGWQLEGIDNNKINIIAHREKEVPGTHIVKYQSKIDSISLKHEAYSREGFANGAMMAAEWLVGKKGVYGMHDMLNLK
jgi:4-hydroxy-tetrahydrodipicolinate reductase